MKIKTPAGDLLTDPFIIQEGKRGKKFRLSSIEKGTNTKWFKNTQKTDWIYTFKYVEDGNIFKIRTGFNDEFIEKL